MKSLIENLKSYIEKDLYAFHMPGHKRKCPKEIRGQWEDIYTLDVTEVEGTDNLHHPESIIKESLAFATEVYRSKESIYLVNGSTCGILSAIRTCIYRNEDTAKAKILIMAENAHYSAYHAVELMDIRPIYWKVDKNDEIVNSVNPTDLQDILDGIANKREIGAIYLTSPSYDGVISDIATIKSIAKEWDIPLIVDAAHGAHLHFLGEDIGVPATAHGADLVIESLHKTLPSLTQTAILHIGKEFCHTDKLKHNISIFETSSPSYIFMAATDLCIRYMATSDCSEYRRNLADFRHSMSRLKTMELIDKKEGMHAYDITKLVFVIKKPYRHILTGKSLQNLLRASYHIEVEYADSYKILALSSMCDDKEAFDALAYAMTDIDDRICKDRMEISDVERDKATLPDLQVGMRYNENIYIYPPGIPILKSGEVLTENIYMELYEYANKGHTIIKN